MTIAELVPSVSTVTIADVAGVAMPVRIVQAV